MGQGTKNDEDATDESEFCRSRDFGFADVRSVRIEVREYLDTSRSDLRNRCLADIGIGDSFP